MQLWQGNVQKSVIMSKVVVLLISTYVFFQFCIAVAIIIA